MDEKTKEKMVNEGNKEVTEKAKTKNAVILLAVISIALLIVAGLVITWQVNMQKVETDVKNNVNSNNQNNVQNIQGNTEVNIYQEEQNKEVQKEQDENEQDVNNNDVTTESKQPEKEQQEQVKVDFAEIADQLFEALGVKEELDKLPELTDEERPQYEKEWNQLITEQNDNVVKIIKDKYPSLSDKQAQDYTTQAFEYAKEYGLRIAKHSQEIIDDAKDAVEAADKANAMSELTLKYMEILTQHMQTNSTAYEPKEKDLKILQQHVMEKSDEKYTVKIKQDKTGYEVIENTN